MAIPFPLVESEQQNLQDSLTAKIPVTAQESADAAYQLSDETTPLMSIGRSQALKHLERLNPTPVPLAELNATYPDIEPFKEDTPRFVADEIATRKRERMRLERIIEQGPDQGFRNFAAGMTPQLMDPVSFAASAGLSMLRAAVTGVMAIRGTGTALTTANIVRANALKEAFSTTGQKFIGNVVEGIAGNAAVEGFNIHANAQEQMDFNMAESLLNVSAGAVAFPAGVLVAKQIAKLPKWALFKLQEKAVQQHLSGRSVDVRPELNKIAKDFPRVDPNGVLPDSVKEITDKIVPDSKNAGDVLRQLDALGLDQNTKKLINDKLIEEGHAPHFDIKSDVDVKSEMDAIDNGPYKFDKADEDLGNSTADEYKTDEVLDIEKEVETSLENMKILDEQELLGKSSKAALKELVEKKLKDKEFIKILRSVVPCERGNL